MNVKALLPRYPAPALDLPLVSGGRIVLGAAPGGRFDLLVFHPGRHCPIRAKYRQELQRLTPGFQARIEFTSAV